MSNIVNSIKKNVKKLYNPVQKLLGITDTTITNVKNSKYTPNFIKKPLENVQSYGKTVIQGRNNYQPSARLVIKQYGDKFIKNMVIIRQPIQSFINTAFNALTFGQFQKKLNSMPYDKLFHLRMVITMEDNRQIQIEKNEVINITLKIDVKSQQEEMAVSIPNQLTLNQLLDGGKNILKDNYFSYSAFSNNCQDYQIALLKGSNLLNPQLENFIKQDVKELAEINPYLKKIANTLTGLGGKFNEIIFGTGIHSKFSKNYKVQSVVFDNKYWTLPKAKKWLLENNYLNDDIDKKENTIRFRQLDPDKFKKWEYYTHSLPNHIQLIIVYKKDKKDIKEKNVNNNNNMHTIKAKGGELIHIDLNSHNAEGKSKNSMKGGRLELEPISQLNSLLPITDFKKTGKILKSKNSFLNNLTTQDILDLKKLFSESNEQELKEKRILAKNRKENVERIKKDIKTTKKKKSPLAKIKGTTEQKKLAISKAKKKYS